MPIWERLSAREFKTALIGSTVREILAAGAVGTLFWGPFVCLVPRFHPGRIA